MIRGEYRYSELTGEIIGCAMAVHSALGNGFQEVIYQRALEIEMLEQRLSFSREQEMPIYYKGQQIGSRRVDFLVDNTVCVELKAIARLEDIHLAQAINYLEAYDLEVGLLINFGARSLDFKRVVNRKFNQEIRAIQESNKSQFRHAPAASAPAAAGTSRRRCPTAPPTLRWTGRPRREPPATLLPAPRPRLPSVSAGRRGSGCATD